MTSSSPDPTTRFRELVNAPWPPGLPYPSAQDALARYIASDECVKEMAKILDGGLFDFPGKTIARALVTHLTTKALEGLKP